MKSFLNKMFFNMFIMNKAISTKFHHQNSMKFSYITSKPGFKTFSTYIPTIFDKIIKKEIKSDIVYEDDHVLAFKDINPMAPIHILIIPKVRNNLTGISQAEPEHIETLGRLLLTAKQIGKILNINDGYRLVINEGENGGQTVMHLHLHLLAGRQMGWPPGTANR
jgi:diadenosine tetraphosphate (Ap4A) HIT family hydrolase